MAKNNIKPERAPTQSATMIILISTVSFGVLSKLIFTALEVSSLFRLASWVIWVWGTAYYLTQTGNGRVARMYLLTMLGIMIFIGLAIYFVNR